VVYLLQLIPLTSISNSSWTFNGTGFFSLLTATTSSSSSASFTTISRGSEEEEDEDDEEDEVEDEESESLNHIKVIIKYPSLNNQ